MRIPLLATVLAASPLLLTGTRALAAGSVAAPAPPALKGAPVTSASQSVHQEMHARQVVRPPSDARARQRVADANGAARLQPSRSGFVNAMQVYPYTDGALFQVYAAPGEVTDIALEPGETLAPSGPVAAGDTVRWIIGDTESGSGPTRRVHILVKPTAADLATNLVINTDRRTYHLELRATPATYMASVSFAYPRDALIAVRTPTAPPVVASAPAPITAPGLGVDALHFRYRITGDKPPWRPLRAFDDGRQVYIQFPPTIAVGEMPPLWVTGASGKPELVNYRVQGTHMVVDRLFTTAELRLGAKRQIRVRIIRDDRAAG